jgi:predicted GTPase
LKIAQHALSYFTFLYRDLKNIFEFPAYHKTKILGAPGKMDKPSRKKWAIEKAQEIWIERDDFKTAQKVVSSKKKDDMSDVLVMCQAFVYLKFIDKIL